ncbi:Mycobacterium numidiamassiliense ORFan [Mycobacterium numidiamassiliense]|uniref:Mycobacterium numidiamassiliense ORFan n=1 Tax=Mycobacterium numidiamassiliense TaxID=1841861 RepID=A0A2U3P903_9MYCO|nr:hypothetical protein [Mycobacterium numidiamassiliense]SPM40211.1 Mycobacterium numidiamassiliense ORFan [Mycobacterium numidiamassiliense]
MPCYDIEVTREGRWWEIRIPALDGVTQASPYDGSYLVVGKVDLVDVAMAPPQWWRGTGPTPRFEYRARAGTIRELGILDAESAPAVDALAQELAARYGVPVHT